MLKFQFDRDCFQGEEVSAKFGDKMECQEEKERKKQASKEGRKMTE